MRQGFIVGYMFWWYPLVTVFFLWEFESTCMAVAAAMLYYILSLSDRVIWTRKGPHLQAKDVIVLTSIWCQTGNLLSYQHKCFHKHLKNMWCIFSLRISLSSARKDCLRSKRLHRSDASLSMKGHSGFSW